MPSNGSGVPSAPPGIPFVFDAAIRKVEEQMASVDSLDVKMGVLVALVGALIAGILAALLASDTGKLSQTLGAWPRGLLILDGTLCFLSICFAFQAFRNRLYYGGLKVQDLVKWSNEEVPVIKEAFLPTLLLTIEHNQQTYNKKAQNASRAILVAFLTLASLLATLAVAGSELLTKR